ncbi:ABC transporter permease [Streptomyces melanosporofaciens]|uniref:Peptide/nickel transport system permease protein n=1 Tax=Streptomyces melanosporofaciens TaxID=67327 RepID=A0A1H4YWK9_STRMJ|nr:ABC transporter permease [Streptomyces melanosporofaciens]SED21391.1 peptide/nickel transport system permease protein [Streptomyces melanosporofaciens]
MTTSTEAPPTATVAVRGGGRPRPPRRPVLSMGLGLVVVLVLAGVLAPLLAPASPTQQGPLALADPSSTHPLGTDEYGRDLFSRVLYGLRQDVFATVIAVPIGALAGILIGLASGLARWLDTVVQRAFDVMLSFTALVAGVTVAMLIGSGRTAVMVTIALVNVPLFGRLIRSSVVSERQRDYVVAAAAIGSGRVRILLRHILPNGLDPLIVQFALSMSTAVFIEGGMSYVGIGIPPPAPSLGSLLQGSMNFLAQNPWYAIGPMAAVTLLVLGFQLVADGLTASLLRR